MGLFTSILQDIRHSRAQQNLRESLAAAHIALQSGQTGPMQRLADGGLGDAWAALAACHASQTGADSPGTATAYYGKAARATEWVDSCAAPWQEEHETRCFLGIGTDPDYQNLYARWRQGHFAGYQREIELAWLSALGPEALRNLAEAWEWLSLEMARWGGHRDPRLPSGTPASLREFLMGSLPEKQRRQIEERALEQARDEFVAGR